LKVESLWIILMYFHSLWTITSKQFFKKRHLKSLIKAKVGK